MSTKRSKNAKSGKSRRLTAAGFTGDGSNMRASSRGGGAIGDDWRCGKPFDCAWNDGNPKTDSVPFLSYLDFTQPINSGRYDDHFTGCKRTDHQSALEVIGGI